MTDVVAIGESLGLYRGNAIGPLTPGMPTTFSFAGAESNVSIGLARLGHQSALLGRVGDDPVGHMIRERLRAEGVDVAGLVVDPASPTALMARHMRTADRVTAFYRRDGSAGSRLGRADVDAARIRSAKILHTTGITMAISPSAREAVQYAVELAHTSGVTVSLDINHRSRLWGRHDAASTLKSVIDRVDVVFGGEEELRLLTDETAPEAIAAAVHELGPAEVVVKRGAQGALALSGSEIVSVPAVRVTCVDPVGAGDAFVAGYLSALLEGGGPAERLGRGALCGAFAVSVPGDWEGLPRRGELDLLSGTETVDR